MKGHSNKPRSRKRDSSPSLIRVDQHDLRDHGDSERIDRVWSRIEQHLDLTPAKAPALRLSRKLALAAGVAAGFGLGIAASALLASPPAAPQTVVMAPSTDNVVNAPQVFAAGVAARDYSLPGGGQLRLSPDSIVDTVAQDDSGLTLRLVRGAATLSGPAGSAGQRLTLRIGDAEVTSIAGRVQARLDGTTADLMMLDGTAAISSPHVKRGEALALHANQRATVPTRAVVASRTPVTNPSVPTAEEPLAPLAVSTSTPPTVIEEPAAAPAAWKAACQGDYAKAVELLTNKASGAEQLMCLATGHQVLKNSAKAMSGYQRVIGEYPGSPYASTAAHYLATLYQAANNTEQADHYRQLAGRLSNGTLLPAQALCQKIEQEAEANHPVVVTSLSNRYREQYPDGPCIDTIERLSAELAARAEREAAARGANVDGAKDDGAEDDGAEDDDAATSGDTSPYDSGDRDAATGDDTSPEDGDGKSSTSSPASDDGK